MKKTNLGLSVYLLNFGLVYALMLSVSCVPQVQKKDKSELEFEEKETEANEDRVNGPRVVDGPDEGVGNKALMPSAISEHCISCHSAKGGQFDFTSFTTLEEYTNSGMLNKDDPMSSLLLVRTKHYDGIVNGNANMPIGYAYGQEDYSALKQWVLALIPEKNDPAPPVVDLVPPSATLSLINNGANGNLLEIVFSEPIQSLTRSHFNLSNIDIGIIAKISNTLYRATLMNEMVGNVLIELKNQSILDLAGNMNQSAVSLNYIVDAPAPPPPVEPPAEKTPFQKAQVVLANKCLSCHNASSNFGKFASYITEQQFVDGGFVVPQNLEKSKLMHRMRYYDGAQVEGAAANMPLDLAFSQEEYKVVKDWVMSLTVDVAPPVGHDGVESQFQVPRLSNNRYVYSVFISNFGESIKDKIEKTVLSQAETFAGNCDLMATAYSAVNIGGKDRKVANRPLEQCYSGNQTVGKSLGYLSPIRSAWVLNSCDFVTNNDEAMNFYLSKAFQGGVVQSPSKEHLQLAYELFYPGEGLSASQKEALMNLAVNDPNHVKAWRDIVLAICSSSNWQVP